MEHLQEVFDLLRNITINYILENVYSFLNLNGILKSHDLSSGGLWVQKVKV
jgi:hypothetical protein